MQQFRKVTTLAEDMASLGLGGHEAAPEASNELTEATLKRVKTKRTTSSQKSKARMAARKGKAKRNRARRMQAKKSTYKTKMKRLKKMKKGKKGGPRTQLRLVTGLGRQGNLFESFNMATIDPASLTKEGVVEAFENVSKVSGVLARKFAIIEELMDLPVIHPESEYGYDIDTSNAVASGKTGDAMDTVAQAPKGNVSAEEPKAGPADTKVGEVAEDDVDPKDPVAEEDEDETVAEAVDDDEVTEEEDEEVTEDDDEEVTEDSEDDEDLEEEDEKDEVQESIRRRVAARLESMPMDFELNAIRLEAENIAAQVAEGAMTPVAAGAVLGDMVSYLGGAMKAYDELAAELQTVYIGTGEPIEIPGAPAPEADGENPKEYIGDGAPEGDSAVDDGDGPKPDQTTPAPATPAKKVAEPKIEAKPTPKAPKVEAKAALKAPAVKAPAAKKPAPKA